MPDEDISVKMLYGYAMTNPQSACRLIESKLTTWQKVRGWIGEIRFWFVQSFLFAISFTCFAYALGAFHAH